MISMNVASHKLTQAVLTDAVHVDAFLLEELTLRQAYALLHLRVRSDREARRLVFMGREACAQMRTAGGLDSGQIRRTRRP